jgi:hypothetical protein
MRPVVLALLSLSLSFAACGKPRTPMARANDVDAPSSAATADSRGGALAVADAAAKIADAVQSTTPTSGARVVHVVHGASAVSAEGAQRLSRLADELSVALRSALEARGFRVARNLAPTVTAGGDVAPVRQPEKLDPAPDRVLYFALSDSALPASEVALTYWTLGYDDYVASGVFTHGSSRTRLLLTTAGH